MVQRSLFVAVIALLLSGCTGWWSEARLIPVSARDTAGLEGAFTSGEARMILSPTANRLVRAIDPAGEEPAGEVALALLREEAPRPTLFEEARPEEGEPTRVILPDRSYLMEVGVAGDEGKTAYTYAIARIGFADDGSAGAIEVFSLVCSKAAEALAARKEQQACIFDDYARLRAAAFDALAWQEDARMPIDTTTWQRASDADEIAPDEP